MNPFTRMIDFGNRKVKQFNIWDLKLVQTWAAVWILIFAKLFPQIIEISIWWFIAILLLCLPRLIYILFMKNNPKPPITPDPQPHMTTS